MQSVLFSLKKSTYFLTSPVIGEKQFQSSAKLLKKAVEWILQTVHSTWNGWYLQFKIKFKYVCIANRWNISVVLYFQTLSGIDTSVPYF